MTDQCEGKCTAPPNRGVRSSYWCGFKQKANPPQHQEHDWFDRRSGRYVHCYG